ncbi:N-6 DNA methylase [Streptomyces sp. NPDC000878]
MQLDLFAELGNESEPPAVPPTFQARSDATPPATKAVPTPESRRSLPQFAVHRSDGPTFGEAIADAWHRAHGGSRMEIPVGVVAALALWPIRDYPRDLAQFFNRLDGQQIVQCVREAAAYHWMRRPDLIGVAHTIFSWADRDDHTKHELHAIREVARAAIRHNVLDYTGSSDPYDNADIDLMSWTITNLRSRGATKGLGEYHTPPEITDMMSRLAGPDGGRGDVSAAWLFEDAKPGMSILDPCAGTGGMFRSSAQHLRYKGLDPADFTWFAQEIDPTAAAGCAVNMIVWGLGPMAMVACGDTLAEGDMWNRAVEHRREMEKRRDRMAGAAAMAAAIERAQRLLSVAEAA